MGPLPERSFLTSASQSCGELYRTVMFDGFLLPQRLQRVNFLENAVPTSASSAAPAVINQAQMPS